MRLRLSILLAAVVAAMALAGTASPAADTITVNSFFPFSFVTSGCGEDILLSGTLHDLFTSRSTPQAGSTSSTTTSRKERRPGA
jgi:hypothetical protein